MGVVWAAVNELTSGEVALKLILQSTEELRLRLLREARICGGLKHRNVIEVHDVGQTEEGDPFLVMQLLSGETLAELLKRERRLDPPVAAQIARDVARALAAVHAAGVIHRDLKPANIFLHQEAGADGSTVKVLDFGVSKNIAMSSAFVTINGGAVGSPAYMSPEQARADSNLDHRADIWSLGVVLFELLAGVRPFLGDCNQVIPRIILGDIPLVSRHVRLIDPDLVALVSRCLERDCARRIGSAAELVTLLQRHVGPTRSNPVEIVAAEEPRSAVEWDDESDVSEALTIALASKRLCTTRPLPEWLAAPPPAAPRVESQSNAASTGSNAEGEIDRQDAYWWRRGGPRGTATVGAVAGLGVPFLARDTAVAPFSGTPAPDGEADLKTDIGLVITTLMPRPTSTVLLSAPAAVTPAEALGVRAVRSAIERLLMGRRALVAILAGGVAVLAVGVGAYEARGGLSTGVPEAVKDARPNPPERLDEPAAPTAAPTPIVSPPSLPIVEIVSPPVPPEVKPPAKKKQAPPAAIKDNQKAGVIAPSRNNPKKWLN